MVACGHDTGYAPFLGQFVGDKAVAERITLLEGSPFPVVIKNLGLKRTRFGTIFNEVMQSIAQAGSAEIWGSNVVAANGPLAVKTGGSSGTITPFTGYYNPRAQSDRLGPIMKDVSERRVDRPLQVNEAIVERIKKGDMCYYLFLRGECVTPTCRRNHAHRQLSIEEFDALWWLARWHGWCFKNQKADRTGNDCSDPMCVYGHKGVTKSEHS